MEKITSLTKEQESKIPIYLQKYYDRVYNGYKIDKVKAESSIKYIYKNAGYKKPYIWYCQSPLQAQLIVNILKNSNFKDNLWSNLGNNLENNLRSNLENNLWSNLGNNLENNLKSNLWSNLGNNLENNLESNLGSNLRSNLRSNLESNLWSNKFIFEPFSYYGNLSDYGWTCFYDFINNELIPTYNLKLWSKWKELIESNIYDMIQLDGLCIVIQMPIVVNINEFKQLHSENNCAVKFEDEYFICAWNGIIVPNNWIMNKNSITKEIIINEKNVEKRRCIQEILGSEKFVELLGVKNIDEDIDLQGNNMVLFRTIEQDNIINKHIYYLCVICPSTERKYYLCIPECKNVWEAKEWTFRNKKIEIRHGDIGLLNLKKEFNQPIFES